MSKQDARILGTAGHTIELTFAPQVDGLAFFSRATIHTEVADPSDLAVTANKIKFLVPAGDFEIRIVLFDGPAPERGSISYVATDNPGPSIFLETNEFLSDMSSTFSGFGE